MSAIAQTVARPGSESLVFNRLRAPIFFASGFAGLIYESIWTHYLKLFLGHAAYAQTVVLVIFMGGMAVGAALASRYSARIANPLKTYALIEAGLAMLAFVFHPIFVGSTDGFFALAFETHLTGLPFTGLKFTLAALLILPQTILLGATFPLFATAATRVSAADTGRSIATLYFANSLGGAFGVLVSGFWLIPTLGLPGTIAAAGAINLVVAVLALALSAPAPSLEPAPVRPLPAKTKRSPIVGLPTAVAIPHITRWLLAAAFLTGLSSFIYEIAWIRMLSLVLGSATHAFEVMLSAFVLGLALGGYWVRTRIDTAINGGVLLAWVQIAMGFAAVATVPLHNLTFDVVAWVLSTVPRTDNGYVLFNLARYGVAMLIMCPAAFCAGMTLPLATQLLYRAGEGERAIGRIYSSNTFGAIVGVLFAVHIGLPFIGLEHLVAVGALIDVVLGAALLVTFSGRALWPVAIVAVLACTGSGAVAAMTFDPEKMTSGVFRTGKPTTSGDVRAIAHGKTSTVSLDRAGEKLTLRNNGKPDASVSLGASGEYTNDQVTQVLSAAYPLLIHDAPRRIANIGMGSGITGATILADTRVDLLDTIEIEPKVLELAKHFTPLNSKVYEDPRSRVRIDDAKSFFASGVGGYDIIVSEPSNPWVSGVASLFTAEFYHHVQRYLNDGGLFAQWFQTYEMSPDRIVTVLKAFDLVFDDYLVFALVKGDILVVGKKSGRMELSADPHAALSDELRNRLAGIEVANSADLIFRVVGNKALLKPWLDASNISANSDFHPYLDAHADRDRFLGAGADPDLLAISALPLQEMLKARPSLPTGSRLSITQHFGSDPVWLAARLVSERLLGQPDPGRAAPLPASLPVRLTEQGETILAACRDTIDPIFGARQLATRVLPYISPADGQSVLAALKYYPCLGKSETFGLEARWPELLARIAERNAQGMAETAEQMLDALVSTPSQSRLYLLGIASLGYLATGNKPHAREVWERHAKTVQEGRSPLLVLDILRAQMLSDEPMRENYQDSYQSDPG